jgi:hypothetical protein
LQLLSARMRVAIRVADRERAPANARGQGMWATTAGCGWRAAQSPVIEYPAPSRRPIVLHAQWRCRQIAIAVEKT